VTATEGIWVRPNLPRARYYKAGWPSGLSVDAEGGRFSAPTSAESVLSGLGGTSPNARLRLGDGSTKNLGISTANLVTNLSPDSALKLKITPTTGIFKGALTYAGAVVACQGIIIREGPNTGGFGCLLTAAPASYTGSGQSVSVVLEPQP
jgi:hypothetical protein